LGLLLQPLPFDEDGGSKRKEAPNGVPDTLEVSIRRARSYANELRHLTELVNHEKY
jgi:hypothetical protein